MLALNPTPEGSQLSVEPMNDHGDDLRAYVGMGTVDASEQIGAGYAARPNIGQDGEDFGFSGTEMETNAVYRNNVMGYVDVYTAAFMDP